MTITTHGKRAAPARTNSSARSARRGKPIALKRGTHVIWSAGVEERYGISAPTRWRWERSGKLPPRDVRIGGREGWRPETLEAAEQQK